MQCKIIFATFYLIYRLHWLLKAYMESESSSNLLLPLLILDLLFQFWIWPAFQRLELIGFL